MLSNDIRVKASYHGVYIEGTIIKGLPSVNGIYYYIRATKPWNGTHVVHESDVKLLD